MLFDNKMQLIDTVMLAEGAVNSVRISARTITEKAIKKNASSIILIHNHPNGLPYPSDDDVRFSNFLKDVLKNLDIHLIDHIIVSGRFYRPVFEGEVGENKFAAKPKFSYGSVKSKDGIRYSDVAAAASIMYQGLGEE